MLLATKFFIEKGSLPTNFDFYRQTNFVGKVEISSSGMGLRRSESLFRWVWEANRGNLVGENATLTFGTNVAWQTNTTNKGVVRFKLLPNGNMVLHNLKLKGKFIWQSFDYPAYTLLVGQSLRAGVVSKLVSRASEKENKDGPYSLVMEPKGLALYYKSSNSPKPQLYFSFSQRITIQDSLVLVSLNGALETDEGHAYDLTLDYRVIEWPTLPQVETFISVGLNTTAHQRS
ncbi:epidermis-specific secreted glycoprotein EP1-like [Pyrus x bretschneideri]|uniref:epidermis-specific secreted glycoprotein EP1-like n=1 Tax=Pyrus x bretschneideri TaxID=225117 RepID=UPI00202E6407|nr:epidermis-specific secreted glycoprotein EP1-like [Pyrus x bretschneideri]